MAWLADAHREWHYVNGANEVCPLDCGVGETYGDEEEASIRCGHCKGYHFTVQGVRNCSQA